MNYKTLDCYNLLLDGCYQLRDESERCVCVPDLPSLWLQFVPEAEITWTDLNDSCDAVWTGAKKEESLQSFAGWFRCFSAEVEMMGVFSLRTHFWDLGLVRYSASSLCCGKCVFTGTLLCPCQRVQKNIVYYQRCQQCCFQRLFWGGKWAVVSGWNWGETRSKINWNTYRSNKQATRHFKVALRCFFSPLFSDLYTHRPPAQLLTNPNISSTIHMKATQCTWACRCGLSFPHSVSLLSLHTLLFDVLLTEARPETFTNFSRSKQFL